MFKFSKQKNPQESLLYNKILDFSRNKLFYAKLGLDDTFQNRISLIFFHCSFLLIALRKKKNNSIYKTFSQNLFDIIFKNIDLNMREIGYGDTTVNKNMKFLIKAFYDILLKSENYDEYSSNSRSIFIGKYLTMKNVESGNINNDLLDYFNKYQSFCLDLTLDKVLKGEIDFNYK